MFKLSELFAYCESTGLLSYRLKRGKKKPGSFVGSVNKSGYIKSCIEGKQYYVHRIIWEMINGPIPEGMQVDHVNGNRADNRAINLRLVSSQGNSRNQKRKNTNSTGITGVSWDSQTNRWRAHITVNGKTKCLGRYLNKLEAIEARKIAERKYSFHENHGR